MLWFGELWCQSIAINTPTEVDVSWCSGFGAFQGKHMREEQCSVRSIKGICLICAFDQ